MVIPVKEDKSLDSSSIAGVNMITAINMALHRAMEDDESVVVFGEDVGRHGGVFRATENLQKVFGPYRAFDTPLSEQLIAGIAVGLGSEGIKAVAEFQFVGFVYPGFDQIINHASRLRNRTRGRLSCPVVFRTPWGGGNKSPEHHSESPEALFAHVPGLRVIIPSSPQRAYGLLLAAITDPDPVMFFEPIRLFRNLSIKEEVIDDGSMLPLDTAFVLRKGNDVTLVSWGGAVHDTLEAATVLSEQDVSAEVIDVASISYLDMKTILTSVKKTGRCVIIHEAPLTGGFGAEIAARLASDGILHLRAPVKRVTAPDTIVPLGRLEEHYLPNVADIVTAATELVSFPS